MSHAGIVQDLIAWIEANLEQPLNIDHVAERAGFSKWYLQRMFKHHTGYPLANYIPAVVRIRLPLGHRQ